MRTLRAGGLAALLLGLAAAGGRGDDEPKPAPVRYNPRPTWGARAVSDDQQAPPPDKSAPANKADKPDKADKPAPGAAGAPAPRPARVADRDREEKAYLRRIAVVDRLREIAIDTRDPDLLRQADQLEEKASALYQQRTGGMRGGDGAGAAERPAPRADGERAGGLRGEVRP
jgi:hypothetical protein